MSLIMDEIQIFESNKSVVSMLHFDSVTLIVVSTIMIGIDSFIGIFIKGLFIYYVQYEAPKNRPINRMILFDQVINFTISFKKQFLGSGAVRGLTLIYVYEMTSGQKILSM